MTNLDSIRANALSRLEQAEKLFKVSFFGAVLVEGLLIAMYVMLADFREPMHKLLFVAVGIVYMPLVLGLAALGAHVNRCTLRILLRLEDGAAAR